MAHLEAIGHFERGLAALAALPEGPARDGREIELQLARGLSLFTAEGFMAAEAAQAYTRARELAEQRGDPRQLFMAVYGLWQSANGAGRILDCRRLSNRLQQLTADERGRRIASAGASQRLDDLFVLPASRRPRASTARPGAGSMIPSGTAFIASSMAGTIPAYVPATWVRRPIGCSGIPTRAWRSAAKHWHWPSGSLTRLVSALALQYNSMLHLDRGEPELALRRLEAAEALAAEQRLGFVLEPQLLRGAALTRAGSVRGGCRLFARGACRPAGATRLRCYGLAMLADALTRQGEHGAALAAAREGLEYRRKRRATASGRRNFIASKASRCAVSTGLKRAKTPSNRRCVSREANRQKPMSCALRRASRGSGAIRAGGQRPATSRSGLRLVHRGIRHRDLKEAKALLDELA